MTIDIATWVLAAFTAGLVWATFKLARHTETLAHLTGQLLHIEEQRENRAQGERDSVGTALLDELRTNLSLIEQKKSILNQIIEHLKDNKLLPGSSAHAITTVYDSLLSIIYTSLDRTQRENLHVIYQHLKLNDAFLDAFERDFKADLKAGTLKHPWESIESYKSKCYEVHNDYTNVQGLIRAYLNGTPVKVFLP